MKLPNDRPQAAQALVRLMDLVSRLRAPDGCPWDREQTAASVANYLLEEAYEAVEAVETAGAGDVCGELGDLLFQVVFLADLFAQEGGFDLAGVIGQVEAKMVRRHPHVFGPERLTDAEAVRGQWGRIKSQERGDKPGGLLDSLPLASPSLVRAQRLGQRAARVGFDWPDAAQVWDKVAEERGELLAAQDQVEAQAELGDLLFALAQWARHRDLNAEAALRGANQRFLRRFQHMEAQAALAGRDLDGLDAASLDELWERAKAALDGGQDAKG